MTKRRNQTEIRVGTPTTNRVVSVDVHEDDIRPWDLDTEHRVVGTDTTRIDAVAKVTGRAKYAYDVKLPGMLYGVMLRSPHPNAAVVSVDLDAARKMPGVVAAIATKGPDTRFEQVRFAGDDVAAVAARTIDEAYDALEAIRVEYEVEEHQTDYLEASNGPSLSNTGEVTDEWPGGSEGEAIEKALAEATHTRTATYRTEVQTHSSLETHGLVADFKDGELEVWASTQATFIVRSGLARVMGIPESKVRVHAEFVGGGFGSKFQPGAEGVAAAMLSREAKAPVKLMLNRHEEHTCAGNRPSATMQIRAGIGADGVITAWDQRGWGGPGYSGRGGGTRKPSYYLENAVTRDVQRDVRTDTDSSRAMRAPGWPQGFFACESMMDELAAAAGMDPLAFRLANDSHVLRPEEWRAGAERFGWAERVNPEPGKARRDDPRFVRGAGLASAVWGQMGGGTNRVTCRIYPDGAVETRNGAQDIGTGMKTVMAMLTAEELGIPVDRVRVSMGDTADPLGPASGGSTTTPSLAPTVRHAAHLAKRELSALVAQHLGVEADTVVFADGKVGVEGNMLSFGEACKLIGPGPIEVTGKRFQNYEGFQDHVCGCQFAEVEVDRETGLVRVLKLLAVQDCGLVLAKKLAESQVIGALIQGLAYALHEQRIMDHNEGRMLNADFLNYKIATAGDMPELDCLMVSVANGKNSVGAAGLGEPPGIATAAAIGNAVANATGARVRSLPITPDKVLAAMQGRTR